MAVDGIDLVGTGGRLRSLQVVADVDGRVAFDEVVLQAALATASRVNLPGWILPIVALIF